jgi:hypothetical protein
MVMAPGLSLSIVVAGHDESSPSVSNCEAARERQHPQ